MTKIDKRFDENGECMWTLEELVEFIEKIHRRLPVKKEPLPHFVDFNVDEWHSIVSMTRSVLKQRKGLVAEIHKIAVPKDVKQETRYVPLGKLLDLLGAKNHKEEDK